MPAGPSPELKKLSYMIGEWSGTFTISMGGNDTPLQCGIKAEWAQKGNFLKTTMTVSMPDNGGKMEGITYLGYDSEGKVYRGFGFEDMSPIAREESGTLDGTKLVMTSKP